VEIEMAGYHVIGGLLNEFVTAVMSPKSSRTRKLLQLVPEQFIISQKEGHLYQDIQSVVDFIAGMTDLYAVDMYRKITGIQLTGI
jgi:dGTPase